MSGLWATITHITHPSMEELGLRVCDELTKKTNILYVNRVVTITSWSEILTEKLMSTDSSIVLFTPFDWGSTLVEVPTLYLEHFKLRCEIFSKTVISLIDSRFGAYHRTGNLVRNLGENVIFADVGELSNINQMAERIAITIVNAHPGGFEWREKHD